MKHTDYTGQTLDNRYRVIRLLGTGGMGSVYLGQHVVIGKRIAVKFLHTEYASNPDVVKRFYREAQAAAAIAHKNIIDVSDVGLSPAKEPYLVMEYLEGESLSSMLERTGPISLPAACGILEPVLSALAAAHEKGIVHRDLKPDNIFLAHLPGEPPPTVKLIDFGISKFTAPGLMRMTGTGALLGTPAYMAPEQIRGEKTLDHRADIYSVGVILYEMLTGRPPYQAEHVNALLIKVLTDDPTPPSEAYKSFPAEVEPLLMRILSKDPAKRPQSATGLLEEIRNLRDFGERHAQLSEYSSGLTNKSFAGGDLGAEAPSGSGGEAAEEVFLELTGKSTPADWAGSRVATKRPARTIAVVAVAALIAALAGFAIWSKGGENKIPAATEAPPSESPAQQVPIHPASPNQAPTSVRIEVKGAPEGASIHYDNKPATSNPITAQASPNATQLKVTAPGYSDYIAWVVPNQDQQVTVSLVPIVEEKTPTAPTKTPAGTAKGVKRDKATAQKKPEADAVPEATATTPPKKPKKKVKVGDKFSYTEDFDEE